MTDTTLAPLYLPAEPTSYGYGANTPDPAPVWLIEKTPGANPLHAKLTAARDDARRIAEERAAAVAAFREASDIAAATWEPRIDVEYDRWRQLRAAKIAAETAEHRAEAPVRAAWHALRDHLAASEDARVEAHRTTAGIFAKVADAFAALDNAVADLAEAERLVKTYSVREGYFTHTFSEQYRRTTEPLRKTIVAHAPKESTK